MAIELRPAVAVLVLAAVLVAGLSGSIIFTEVTEDEVDPELPTVDLEHDDRDLWIYTANGKSFDRASIAINLVIYGNPTELRDHLLDTGEWNETDEDVQAVDPSESIAIFNASFVDWGDAEGESRYIYLTDNGGGQWYTDDYQIHDGDFFGSRYHARMFPSPDNRNWTAIQAHYEHWDWFGSRHIVSSTEEAQRYLENDIIEATTGPVIRIHVGVTDHIDFDGWLTVGDLTGNRTVPGAAIVGILLIGATLTGRVVERFVRSDLMKSQELRTLLLASGSIAVLLSVRLLGVGLEQYADLMSLAIYLPLYPVVLLGPPVVTYLLARPLDRSWAFVGGAGGFALAVIFDFTYLGVTLIPVDILVHRAGLAVALGLIAAGASRTERESEDVINHLQFGVLLWLVGVILPLLRHTALPV